MLRGQTLEATRIQHGRPMDLLADLARVEIHERRDRAALPDEFAGQGFSDFARPPDDEGTRCREKGLVEKVELAATKSPG